MKGAFELTAQELRQILHYDPETGVFTWLIKPSARTDAGSVAGSDNGSGYLAIGYKRKRYYCHRLAVLWMTGEWPEDRVDHRDGDTHNNAWGNLRDTSQLVNQQNQRRPRSDNTTGFLGVYPQGDKFIAQIGICGKRWKIGQFDTAEEASEAYLSAKRDLHEGCTI